MPPETIMENADKSKATLCQAFCRMLGMRLAAVQIPEVVAQMEERITRRKSGHYVTATAMHGVASLLFERENSADLAVKVDWARNHSELLARKRRAARAESDAKYEPSMNYEIWMQWYGRVRRG
jgi:hypothetical protein